MKYSIMAFFPLIAICLPCYPLDRDTMQANTWYLVDARDAFLDRVKNNKEAQFSTRGWCKMVTRPEGGILFYEGFHDSIRGETIYANALYWFNPVTEVCSMMTVSNWSRSYIELSENAAYPTPLDRHTYNQFCYAASSNSIYLAGGACGAGHHPVDAWGYSLTTAAWTKIADTCPGFAGYNGDFFDNPYMYSPGTSELLLFKTASTVHAYNLTSGLWSIKSTPANAASTGMLGTGNIYDPVRQRLLFFGGAWEDSQNTLKVYYSSGNRYETITPTGTLPPRVDYANISYAQPWDVFFTVIYGQTWYYSPASNAWTQLATTGVSLEDIGMYCAYDSVNNLLVVIDKSVPSYYNVRFKVMNPELSVTAVQTGAPAASAASIVLSPNPLKGEGRITLSGLYAASCVIYDVQGAAVSNFDFGGSGKTVSREWNASRLPSGVYTLVVRSGGRMLTRKAAVIR